MLVVFILCLVLLGDSTTGAETECGQPQRVNGALPKPEYRDVSSFAHNATIEYRCDVTHYLVDLTSWFRTCLNGKWDDVQFRCIAKTCPALTTPVNGKRVGYNHEVGTFAKFKCNDGYEMMGVAQLLCRTDMEWSPEDPPTCKPVGCRDDSFLANGRVFQETFRQEKNTYGITNRYSCNTGYDLKGPSIRTCQADKTWSGIQPICDKPRCPEIMAEHGEVEYMGDRGRYTYAFITCEEGYSLGKDGVETVECLRSLQWKNTLHCYKMVKSWNPEHSYTQNRKDTNVEHNEKYKIHCYERYEMKQNGRYLGGKTKPSMSVRVMNLNGKLKYRGLDAHTLSCVEKRCFREDINLESTSNLIVEPNREYVEHGQSFHLSCENGYEDSLGSDPNVVCNYGKLDEKRPECTPKPCATPTIENGKLTKSGYFFNSEYSKPSINSGQSVSASCEDNFFLYDNSRNNFTKETSMSIKCELGNMTFIPSCRNASKCEFPDDPFASYYVNGDDITGMNTISHEVEVRVKCESGTKMTVSSAVRRCWDGAWKYGKRFPVCEPESCRVTKEKGRRFIKDDGEVRGDVKHGQTVTVECDTGFDLIGANSEIQCRKGHFDHTNQCAERCAIPEIPNANITRLNGTKELKHGDMIKVTCPEGQRFQSVFYYDDYKYYDSNDPNSIFTCNNGTITELGNKECELPQDFTGQPRSSSTAEPNATTGEPNATTAEPNATTAEPNATTTAASTTKNTTETSTESDTTTISSGRNELSVDNDTGVLHCTIPASDDFKFLTLSGLDLIEGTEIMNGRQIIAEKKCEDYYLGYDYAYHNYDASDEEISPKTRLVNKTVNCSKGSLSDYTLVCDIVESPDSSPDECRTVPNGTVTDNGQSIECNEGYVNVDPLLYERYSCSCNRTLPALVCNGRRAKCEPINCKLNSPIEQGMTLKYKGTFITASTLEAIDHGKSVTFKCEIGDNKVKYEPNNRLFRCDRGNWIEDNRRDPWTLGNNGKFPKCRPANCYCQHGGTCIRDNTCVCTAFSTGAQCGTPICPSGCQNGGSCTSPNRCSCLERFSGRGCETEGCGAPIENVDDRFYQIGATYTVTRESCSHGNIPSFKGQITCDNGHWSEQVSCLNGTRYSIRVKTADLNNWWRDEGTDGEVYLNMFGSKGNSGKIILNGEFEAGDEDLTKGQFVDVGEIFQIRLGVKALSLTNDGWKPESVVIEDVSRREYYKFVHDLTEIDDTSIILYRVASCSPPQDVKNVDFIYFVGDELHLGPSNCAEGYKPQPAYTKCTEEGWTADVVCVQRSSYRIRVKTVDWRGSPQNVHVMIYGTHATTNWKTLSGNLGPGQITEKRFEMENIGQIKKLILSVSKRWWIPDYATIHDEGTNDLYVFRYNRRDFLYNTRTELHPEGKLSGGKADIPDWEKDDSVRVGSEYDCLNKCIQDPECKQVLFMDVHNRCKLFNSVYRTVDKPDNANWIYFVYTKQN